MIWSACRNTVSYDVTRRCRWMLPTGTPASWSSYAGVHPVQLHPAPGAAHPQGSGASQVPEVVDKEQRPVYRAGFWSFTSPWSFNIQHNNKQCIEQDSGVSQVREVATYKETKTIVLSSILEFHKSVKLQHTKKQRPVYWAWFWSFISLWSCNIQSNKEQCIEQGSGIS